MSRLGPTLDSWGSALFDNPLGVVQMGYKGYDLGLTSADTTLKPDQDLKEITAQQKGTKNYDLVRTGIKWMLSATFTEMTTEKYAVLFPGLVSTQGSAGSDSATYKGELYKSLIENESGPLRSIAMKNGCVSNDIEDEMNFYIAIPKITAEIANWGADTQRALVVDFEIYSYEYQVGQACYAIHGYHGDPTLEGIPATDYPDLEAPYVTAAEVTLATEMTITMSEEMTLVSGVTAAEQIIVKVEGKFVAPTSVAFATNVITLTMPASTFTSGDVVEVNMSAETVEDSESNENENVDSFSVTNSL